MHRISILNYAGKPGEVARYTTHVEGGGHVVVTLDGSTVPESGEFPLKTTPGEQTLMRTTLFGATGESCVVGISEVDGGTDADLLICQPHDPAPSHTYIFIVAAPATLTTLTALKQGAPVRKPQRQRKRRPPR